MRKKGMSRRELLGLASLSAVSATVGAGASVLTPGARAAAAEVPKVPWPYQPLDPEDVRKRGHQAFYEGDCMYGTFNAVISALRDKVGAPYDRFPSEMMKYGKGGLSGWGSLCGALNGGSAAISLVAGADFAKLVPELAGWYTETPFPSEASNNYAKNHQFRVKKYKSDKVFPGSVSNSTLCHVSVTNWCKASGYASGSPERAERCARLAGDVAARAVELLNAYHAKKFKAAFVTPAAAQVCQSCHSMGPDFKKGQFTQGRENCSLCHKPHKI